MDGLSAPLVDADWCTKVLLRACPPLVFDWIKVGRSVGKVPDWLIASSWIGFPLTAQMQGIERGITALGPCNLGLAADQVIIDPILGPTGQVCPSGVPHKPLR